MGRGGLNKEHLSAFSIIIAFVALMLIGLSLVSLINLQLEPSRSLPSMNIFYSWPNASARVIEKEVTTKLEGFFNSVKGIKGLNSVTTKGSGRISLSFKKGSNLDVLRFEVAMLIRRVYPDLPEQVSYPVLSLGTGGQKTSPLLTYTVNASANPYYIQKYTEDNIATKISGIKGLNEVKVYGATPFEWEIQFNTNAIDNLGLSVNEISTAINNYFKEEISGWEPHNQKGNSIPTTYGFRLATIHRTS